MANEIAGFRGVFGFSTSTGGAIDELGSLKGFSLNMNHAPIDVTTFDSSGSRDFVAGLNQWDGTADYLQVQTATDHKALSDLIGTRTKIDFVFYPTGSSSDGYYSGSGFFTNWGISAPMEDALSANVAFQGTGTLTRTSSST